MPTIYTVGHSRHTFEQFSSLLASHAVRGVADVRRYPGSRRYPQFARGELEAACRRAGLEYRHFESLGGYRDPRPDSVHTAWEEPAFRAYADHMETAEFASALAALATWARSQCVAVMCAEASPLHCHRRVLADALECAGLAVEHIVGPRATERHALPPFARREGPRIIYDGGMLRFG
ncbi:MAG: DUF488 family protein [Planctomycetota bacterium]